MFIRMVRALVCQAGLVGNKWNVVIALACCLYKEGGDQNTAEAKKLFGEVPGLMQRIAGRSIPLEVGPLSSSSYRLLEGLNMINPFYRNTPPVKHGSLRSRDTACCSRTLKWHTISSASHGLQNILLSKGCCPTSRLLSRLYAYFNYFADPDDFDHVSLTRQVQGSADRQAQYEGGLGGFWDDYCLAHFLHAVCLRYVAHEVIGSFLRCCYSASGFLISASDSLVFETE